MSRGALVGACCAALVGATVPAAPAPPPPCHDASGPAAASSRSAARVMSPQPHLADVPFVDGSGRATTLLRTLDVDGPVLVNFIFTSCTTICPIMSAGFAQLRSRLGPRRDSVRLVSISIDPETDSVDRLRTYGGRYDATPSWTLLTGSLEASRAAQRAFGAYRGDKSNHAPATYLRRSRTEPWEVLEGLASADQLLQATGLEGASHGD